MVRESADAQQGVALADVTQNGVETEGATGIEVGMRWMQWAGPLSRELVGAALEAGPVTVRATMMAEMSSHWRRRCLLNVGCEAFGRRLGWGSVESWRLVCSRWPQQDGDGGLRGLGWGERRSLFSEARGGLERGVTGRCREAYRAKASLGWNGGRQRGRDLRGRGGPSMGEHEDAR